MRKEEGTKGKLVNEFFLREQRGERGRKKGAEGLQENWEINSFGRRHRAGFDLSNMGTQHLLGDLDDGGRASVKGK